AGPARRFALARSLSQTTLALARRAMRRSQPGTGESDIGLTFVAHHYGPDLAGRLRQAGRETGPMQPPDVLAALTPVVQAFEDLGIAYHVGGSLASSVHGLPRATADVDLVAGLGSAH